MISTNRDGSLVSGVIIGKVKSSRNKSSKFSATNSLKYFYNSDGWMTTAFFTFFFASLIKNLTSMAKVLLDNFSSHQ
jgi:DDE superfamily endonuclease